MSSTEERRTVSRKTPLDGKLEVSRELVSAIAPDRPLTVRMGERVGDATVTTMRCTCRGPEEHVHYFLESSLFRSLTVGSDVRVTVASAERIEVSPVA